MRLNSPKDSRLKDNSCKTSDQLQRDNTCRYMYYNIIADAGSTKIDWVFTDREGVEVKRFSTAGINALLADRAHIESILREVNANIEDNVNVGNLYYYGAGCATPAICDKIGEIMKSGLNASSVMVASDLLGAARSLLGNSRGIACILGTGSNSCLYDGNQIISNVPSLGYILGDEGSGAALGKRLVSDAFKGQLPTLIKDRFLDRFNLSLGVILDKVYREPNPNRFLASLVPFIHEHLWNPYIYSLVRQEFENFLVRNVSSYSGSRNLPICFTGSIAFHFSDILRQVADSTGFTIGTISRQPLDGLIKYHSLKQKDSLKQ